MRRFRIALAALALAGIASQLSPARFGAAAAGAFGPWSTAGALSLVWMLVRGSTGRGLSGGRA